MASSKKDTRLDMRLLFGKLLPILVLEFLIVSCATPPILGNELGSGSASLEAQVNRIINDPHETSSPRYIFIGAAMNDNADAFEDDIFRLDAIFKNQYRKSYRSVLLTNRRLFNGQRQLPLATIDNLDYAINKLANNKLTTDRFILLISSHGLKQGIVVEQMPKYRSLRILSHEKIKTWMDILAPNPTWLNVSTCFAGAAVRSVAADHLIIMTASDADHTSFGCGTQDDGTWFVNALAENINFDLTFNKMWKNTEAQILEEENKYGATHSNPQIIFGESMKELKNEKISAF